MIAASPNLTVLKIESDDGILDNEFFNEIVSQCKHLETFFFKRKNYYGGPLGSVAINHFSHKIDQNMKQLKHLKYLDLRGWDLQHYSLTMLTENIPSLKIARVNGLMRVSASVSESELQNFFIGYDDILPNYGFNERERRLDMVAADIF